MIGVGTSKEDGICINGGSVEIGTATGGYAFIYLDFEHLSFNPIAPDLSGYVGAYKMTAGTNVDGSDATDFNELYLSSYKYVKVEALHVHNHGTAWESDANEHWNECECGDKANKAAHNDGNADGKCDVCDYQMTNGGGASEPKDGLSAGAIVGIAVGSVAVVGVGGFALVWFVVKKKTWADLVAIFKK
ncbi:MAG: hypothetical protein J6C93_03220 [Clostridia bacterium]|nr:hypothetical protein [Clostridia bacterium]